MDMLRELDCPECSSPLFAGEALMGCLGKRAHMRCTYCGWQWSERIEEVEEDADAVLE